MITKHCILTAYEKRVDYQHFIAKCASFLCNSPPTPIPVKPLKPPPSRALSGL